MSNPERDWQDEYLAMKAQRDEAMKMRGEMRAEVERLRDKAIRFDLDQAGIESREKDAVELVERRAEVERLRAESKGRLEAVGEQTAKLEDAEARLAKVVKILEPSITRWFDEPKLVTIIRKALAAAQPEET